MTSLTNDLGTPPVSQPTVNGQNTQIDEFIKTRASIELNQLKMQDPNNPTVQKCIDLFTRIVSHPNDDAALYDIGKIYVQRAMRKNLPNLKNRGIFFLSQSARQGNAKAQYQFAVSQKFNDPTQTIDFLTRAAEQGHLEAQFELGKYYSEGQVEYSQIAKDPLFKDLEKAKQWYARAAVNGHAGAQYALGCLEADQQPPNMQAALVWWERAAAHGKALATARLLRHYALDLQPPHPEKALSYLLLLAAQKPEWTLSSWTFSDNERRAILSLAEKSTNGDDLVKLGGLFLDREQKILPLSPIWAFHAYSRAAEQGHLEAQFQVGKCYEWGCGVPLDRHIAKKWFLKAAQQGHVEALEEIGDICNWLNDTRGAVHWWTQAAEKNHPTANSQLYTHYLKTGDPQMASHYLFRYLAQEKNPSERRIWLRIAAREGNYDAKEMLENENA